MESFRENDSKRIQEKTNQIYLRLGKYIFEKYSPYWKGDIEPGIEGHMALNGNEE